MSGSTFRRFPLMELQREQPTYQSVYEFIRSYTEENGFSPTLREIATGCYLGRSTVLRCLDKLEAKGRISREPNKARSIVLLEED